MDGTDANALESYFQDIIDREAVKELPSHLQSAFDKFCLRYAAKSSPAPSVSAASTAALTTGDYDGDRISLCSFPSPINPYHNARRTSIHQPPPSDITNWETIPSRQSQISETVLQRKATQLQAPFQQYLDNESHVWHSRYRNGLEAEAEAAAQEARQSVLRRHGASTVFPQNPDLGRSSRFPPASPPPRAASAPRTPPTPRSRRPRAIPTTLSSRSGRETLEKVQAEYDLNNGQYQETWEHYKAVAKEAATLLMNLEDLKVKMMGNLLAMDRLNEQGPENESVPSETPNPMRTPVTPLTPRQPISRKVAATDNFSPGEGDDEERWRFAGTTYPHGGGKKSSRRRGQGSRGRNNANKESPEPADGS
ncbi:hypothetical protein LY78DRAFT_686579 [Colletotrichum sublineola]|nr:hypothetical protein LY78DRAFT_686579 [Colletotrichum sublineola]